MRDASLLASAVIATGTTSDTYEFGLPTTGYSGSAAVNTAGIDSRSRFKDHQTGAGQTSLLAVFQITADAAFTDVSNYGSFYGQVFECDTVGGTYVECARTAVAASAVNTAGAKIGVKAGSRVTCQVPTKHKKFLQFKVAPIQVGTQTLSDKNVMAWFEPGANQ
jgi:hypothetical protein